MNPGSRGRRQDELMEALATYLEIIENGGDGEVFLRQHSALEAELRELVGLDASLRVEVPDALFAGRARSYRRFQDALRSDRAGVHALAWFKPRLFGVIGAVGLGMGLSAAFTSGALPAEKISGIFTSLPVIGFSPSASEPPLEELIVPKSLEQPSPLQHPNPFLTNTRPEPADVLLENSRREPEVGDVEEGTIETQEQHQQPGQGPVQREISNSPQAIDRPDSQGLGASFDVAADPVSGQAGPMASEGNGVGSQSTPPLGGNIPGNDGSSGVGEEPSNESLGPDSEIAPGQSSDLPNDNDAEGQSGQPPNGAEGLGSKGAPGQGGEIPGNANGNGEADQPPGSDDGLGPEGAPGHGGEIPSNAGGNGQTHQPSGSSEGSASENAPGLSDEAPSNAINNTENNKPSDGSEGPGSEDAPGLSSEAPSNAGASGEYNKASASSEELASVDAPGLGGAVPSKASGSESSDNTSSNAKSNRLDDDGTLDTRKSS